MVWFIYVFPCFAGVLVKFSGQINLGDVPAAWAPNALYSLSMNSRCYRSSFDFALSFEHVCKVLTFELRIRRIRWIYVQSAAVWAPNPWYFLNTCKAQPLESRIWAVAWCQPKQMDGAEALSRKKSGSQDDTPGTAGSATTISCGWHTVITRPGTMTIFLCLSLVKTWLAMSLTNIDLFNQNETQMN